MKNVGKPIGKEILDNINPFEDNVQKIVEYINHLIEKYKGDLKQDEKLVINSPCGYDFGKSDDLVRLILNFRSEEIKEAFKRFYIESGFAVYFKSETLLVSLDADDLFEKRYEIKYKTDELRGYIEKEISEEPRYFHEVGDVFYRFSNMNGLELTFNINGKDCLYRIKTNENWLHPFAGIFENGFDLVPINENAKKKAKQDGVMKLNIWDKTLRYLK